MYVTTALTVIGVLAFITALIVQVIKELPGLSILPTSLVALIVAEVVTVLTLVTYCSYTRTVLMWYYVTSALICGFIVYMVATGGWEKLNTIWKRTKYIGKR